MFCIRDIHPLRKRKKEIAVFVHFSEIHMCALCERKHERSPLFLRTIEDPFREAKAAWDFKSIVAKRKLARVVTSSTKNDGRRSFRLEYRDCYPTSSGNDLLLTLARRRHYFSLNEWPSVYTGRGFEKRKIMWALFSRTTHYFPVTSLSVLPFSSSQPLVPCNDPSREPVIFTPKCRPIGQW